MAQRKDDKKSNSSGSGLGGFLTFVGGSLVGAALAYGAVKLSEYTQEQDAAACGSSSASNSQPKQIDDNDDDDTANRVNRSGAAPRQNSNPLPSHSASQPGPASFDDRADALLERLNDFHRNHLQVPDEVVQMISKKIDKIEKVFQQALSEELGGNININIPNDLESLQSVLQCLDGDVTMTLPVIVQLDDQCWELASSKDGAGFYHVVKKNSEKPQVTDPWLRDDRLNSEAVKKHFTRLLSKTSISSGLVELLLTTAENIPALNFLLSLDSGQKYSVNVLLQPSCRLQDKVVEVSSVEGQNKTGDLSLWKQNFSPAHTYPRLNSLQIKCIQILVAISRTSSAELGFLTMEMLHSLILQVAEMEDTWDDIALSERFIDLLKGLEEYCHYKVLAHYFVPQWNLLAGVDGEQLQMATDFISRNIGRNTLHHLLNK